MDNELPLTEKTLLFWAVIQAQDLENAQESLSSLGFVSTRLPSVGGFLGRRNATLLVGVTESRLSEALDSLQENCRQRIEYIAVPLESAPLPLPTPTPITIGGATIFTLEVDHFEVI
ncbi:MAG: cyclic-di-AMP receptor [Chloroflexi bacterium]|nr:cyclic-di-AMP receptor [Chloroflexota bacterium]